MLAARSHPTPTEQTARRSSVTSRASALRAAGLLAQSPLHDPGRDLDTGREAEFLQDVRDVGGDGRNQDLGIILAASHGSLGVLECR
jgi:hypothetical protein